MVPIWPSDCVASLLMDLRNSDLLFFGSWFLTIFPRRKRQIVVSVGKMNTKIICFFFVCVWNSCEQPAAKKRSVTVLLIHMCCHPLFTPPFLSVRWLSFRPRTCSSSVPSPSSPAARARTSLMRVGSYPVVVATEYPASCRPIWLGLRVHLLVRHLVVLLW